MCIDVFLCNHIVQAFTSEGEGKETLHYLLFLGRMSVFYERVFPALMSKLSECDAVYGPQPTLVKKIKMTRSLLLVGFRSLLHHKCLEALQLDSWVLLLFYVEHNPAEVVALMYWLINVILYSNKHLIIFHASENHSWLLKGTIYFF